MVLGVVTLGVPYVPPAPSAYHKFLPEGFYISRWQVILNEKLRCMCTSINALATVFLVEISP